MTQRQLEIFVTLAQTLNFTRTAEHLYLSQTTVTLQIRNLEEELGVQLFDRTSRSVKLTAAGRTFLDGAAPILKQMDAVTEKTRDVAKEFTGFLEVGFASEANATGIAAMMGGFIKTHPDIRLRIYGGYPSDLMDGLVAEKYDIILSPVFQNTRSDNLQSYQIGHYDLVAAFRKDHRFAKKKAVTAADFENEKMIYISNPDLQLDFTTQFIHLLDKKKIRTEVVTYTDNIESVLIMLEAGQGITVLPSYFQGRFHETSGLKACRIKENLKGVTFSAMWQKGKLSREKRLFIEHLKSFYCNR